MSTPTDPRLPRRPPPPPTRQPNSRAMIPHPPTELETRDLAELGQRTAHPPGGVSPTTPKRPTDPARNAPGTPATMPTQRPGAMPSQPTEQPRPHPPRPVPRSTASPSPGAGMNQGEGDRASARVYAEHVQAFVVAGGVEPAARDAARAVDGPEAASLRAAEEAGKAPAKLSLFDRAKGALRRVVDVIRERRER